MLSPNIQKLSLDEIIVSRVSYPTVHDVKLNMLTLSEEASYLNEGISDSTLKYVANIAKLYRRKHLATWQSDEINNLTVAWKEINEFFEQDQDDIKEWLATPLPALEGARTLSH